MAIGWLIPGCLRAQRWWPAWATQVVLGMLAAEAGAAPTLIAVYSAAERPRPLPLNEPHDWLVDLNRASLAELQALPGLGSSRADAIIAAEPGILIDLGADMVLDALGPSIVDADARNDSGIVLCLRHGEVSTLLTAAIEAEEELRLARAPWSLQSNVLKVRHDGSATSTMDPLLRRVRPSLAVISAGAGNQFGHPHGEVLRRLTEEAGATLVLRTDIDGRIRRRSDGVSVTYRSVRSLSERGDGSRLGESGPIHSASWNVPTAETRSSYDRCRWSLASKCTPKALC